MSSTDKGHKHPDKQAGRMIAAADNLGEDIELEYEEEEPAPAVKRVLKPWKPRRRANPRRVPR